MLLSLPILAVALALIALALIVLGRGAASGQFREAERRRDRIARHVCLVSGITILIVYTFCLIF